jgi:hypothetical protein
MNVLAQGKDAWFPAVGRDDTPHPEERSNEGEQNVSGRNNFGVECIYR